MSEFGSDISKIQLRPWDDDDELERDFLVFEEGGGVCLGVGVEGYPMSVTVMEPATARQVGKALVRISERLMQ